MRQLYDFSTIPVGKTPQSGQSMAGHAQRDITPPPHMPKAGYSANAKCGKGFRTRLKARAFYLRAEDGLSFALVQLDLLGGSLIVRQRVLENVSPVTDIGPGQLMLGATHTHSGPGNFCASEFYNRYASNKSGFDPVYFEFLSQQIAEAVIEAYQSARPARVASGQVAVWGLTRNRSLIPHFENTQRLVTAIDSHTVFYAIDPRLNLLRIDALHDDGKYYPLGAISTFSIHATGVPQQIDEYTADLWAHVERDLANQVAADFHTPWPVLHAAIEGNHGDMTPAIHVGAAGYMESRRIGEAIAQAALRLFGQLEPSLTELNELQLAFEIRDLHPTVGHKEWQGLPEPMIGAATAAGARENTTPFLEHLPPFKAGWRKPVPHRAGGPAHGAKVPMIPAVLRKIILPAANYPHYLPLQLVKIGDWLLAGLPFEITVGAGQRIESALRTHPALTNCRISLSSVCNDYWGYCTTEQEYACQFYEGGHTLYGPHSNAIMADWMQQLAGRLLPAQSIVDQPERLDFRLSLHRYMPESALALDAARWLTEPVYRLPIRWEEGFWSAEWLDVNPSQIDWHRPLAHVEASDDHGQHWWVLTDDEGVDMSVRWIKDTVRGMSHYSVNWFNPEFAGARQYRLVVQSRASGALISPVFGGNCLTEKAVTLMDRLTH